MQENIKNEKTRIFLGSSRPAAATLAEAEIAADTGFGCIITNMDGAVKSRGTESDDAVYCTDDDSFSPDDTGELKVSNFTFEGFVKKDSADYDAVEALAESMIQSDTQGTFLIIEPDGVSMLWFEVKVVKWGKKRGGPKDKQKFEGELLVRTLPKAV